jgi:hypothetical protein
MMVVPREQARDLLQLLHRRDCLLLLSSENSPDARQQQHVPAHVAMRHRVLAVAVVTYVAVVE